MRAPLVALGNADPGNPQQMIVGSRCEPTPFIENWHRLHCNPHQFFVLSPHWLSSWFPCVLCRKSSFWPVHYPRPLSLSDQEAWAPSMLSHRSYGQEVLPLRPKSSALCSRRSTSVLSPEISADPSPSPRRWAMRSPCTTLQGEFTEDVYWAWLFLEMWLFLLTIMLIQDIVPMVRVHWCLNHNWDALHQNVTEASISKCHPMQWP